MSGNTLKGADEMKRLTVRVHEDLADEFDEWAEENHGDRSKAVRTFMRDAVGGGVDAEDLTPLQPPREELLSDSYRKLCAFARRSGSDAGIVRTETAERICSGGAEGLSKEDVDTSVLRPLQRRGYLRRISNIYGESSWRINGWDDE